MLRLAPLLLSLAAALLTAAAPLAQAAGSDATARQKARAENQKASVEKRLSDMRKALSAREAESDAATEALKKADQAISDANRRLRSLATERTRTEARLAELRSDGRTVGKGLDEAERLLARIARARYAHSQRSAWQLILEGGNPNELSRTAAELRYLSLAQERAAESLGKERSRIETVARETRARRAELVRIAREEESSRAQLMTEKRDRQAAVTRLSRDIATRQAAIDKLLKDQARLETLVAQIDSRLAKERAAEEAARKREAARKAEEATKSRSSAASKPVPPAPAGNFAQLKGRLVRPVKGRVAATFGSARSGSAVWQGMLFRVPEGTEVAACAAGRVVFSDWLRGYGNLIIVDHGGTYMSVYANNESILRSVGDRVKAGETIATAGASGASDEPGLYFEIRYKGKPVNPQPWLGK